MVVGVVLATEGFDNHVPKGHVYFGLALSLEEEMLNIRIRKKSTSGAQLHAPHIPGE